MVVPIAFLDISKVRPSVATDLTIVSSSMNWPVILKPIFTPVSSNLEPSPAVVVKVASSRTVLHRVVVKVVVPVEPGLEPILIRW